MTYHTEHRQNVNHQSAKTRSQIPAKGTFQRSHSRVPASSTFPRKRRKPAPLCHPGLSVSLPIFACAPICQARCTNALCGQTGTRMGKHCLDARVLVGTKSGRAQRPQAEAGLGTVGHKNLSSAPSGTG